MAEHLVLVRHGRIAPEHVGHLVGSSDLPLDSVGHGQARALTDRVGRWLPCRCYCSPMTRCRQTASAMLPGQSVRFDDDLREIDFGQWEGRDFAEVSAQRPDLVERWRAFAPDFAFPGGESVGRFLDRVRRAADRLACEDEPTVLAVTHGGVIRAMICHLLGLEPWQYVLFDVRYGAVVVLRLFDGKGVLTGIESPETEVNGRPAPRSSAE